MQHRNRSTRDLRSLPPRDRAQALRKLMRERLPHIPNAVVRFPAIKHSRHGKGIHSLAAGLMAAAALVFAPPHAAHAGTLRLDLNLASVHTERWARESLNQRNPGIGTEYQANRTWAIAGGVYSNSYRRPTAYALAEWTPLHIGSAAHWHADAGFAAGFASGYRRGEIPCAPLVGAAMVRITAPAGIALNVFAVPNAGAYRSGFVGLELSIPLRWRARR